MLGKEIKNSEFFDIWDWSTLSWKSIFEALLISGCSTLELPKPSVMICWFNRQGFVPIFPPKNIWFWRACECKYVIFPIFVDFCVKKIPRYQQQKEENKIVEWHKVNVSMFRSTKVHQSVNTAPDFVGGRGYNYLLPQVSPPYAPPHTHHTYPHTCRRTHINQQTHTAGALVLKCTHPTLIRKHTADASWEQWP